MELQKLLKLNSSDAAVADKDLHEIAILKIAIPWR